MHLALIWITLIQVEQASAQRVRLQGQTIPAAPGNVTQGPPPVVGQPPAASLPPALNTLPTNGPAIYGQPGVVGQPTFQIGAPVAPGQVGDPFQTNGFFAGGSPGTIPGGVTVQNPNQGFIYPPANNQPFIGPGTGMRPTAPSNSFGNTTSSAWPNQVWSRFQSVKWQRLFERPRFRYTFIAGSPGVGDDANELQVHDVEVATTVNFPNFLWSGVPLRVSPGFVYHFWNGPNFSTGFELPPRAYSAYFAFDLVTPIERQFGAELNFTLGVYSDFDHTTSDSIRLTGVGLGWWRMTNFTTVKLGVEYLDRLDVKILPAFGIFISPSDDLKFDLYFPRPRIARRIPNWGNYEIWGYLGGEYGGGNWTLRRRLGLATIGDRVDMNDLRVFVGLEWLGPRNVTGFAEFGFVFDRELVFLEDPVPDPDPLRRLKLEDSFMIRAGLAF